MTTPPFNPPSNDPGGPGDSTQPLATPGASGPPASNPLAAQGRNVPPGSGHAASAGPQPAPGFEPGSTLPPGPTYHPGPGFESGSSYPPGASYPPGPGGSSPFQPAAPEPTPVLVPPVTVRASSGSSRMLNVALGAAVLIAAAGVSFAVGRATAPATAATTGRFGGGFAGNLPNASFDVNGRTNGEFPNGGFRGGALAGGGLTIEGTVDSVSADSVTITTSSGTQVTIGLDSSTTYHQQSNASSSDVQSGKTVILRLSGNGFRIGNGNGNANASGAPSLGTASDVTVVP